jgi:hypothetical protein
MAKTPTAEAAATSVTVGAFTFDVGLPIPSATRSPAKASDDAAKLEAMPVGASFLVPVVVPESVTDAAEIEKTFREKVKSTTNRLSGLVRRFKKAHSGYEFALRTVNDAALGRGVRVFRVEAAAVATEGSTAPASA